MPEIYAPTPEDQQLFEDGQAMFDSYQAEPEPVESTDSAASLLADEDDESVGGTDSAAALLADDPVPASNDDLGVSKESITFAPSEVKGKGIIDGAKAIAGKIMDRAEELTVGQYKRGKQNERVGLLYNKFLQTGDETFKQEALKLEQSMTEQPEMDSIPSKIVGYTAEQLPQFPGRAKRAVEEALDEDAGSQLELGDRVGRAMLGGFDPALRVAKAFLYDYNAEVMTGHAYAELDKIVDPENGKGIDEEIKQRFAKGIGAVSAVVENASLLPLGRLVPGGSKVLGTAVTNGISAMLRSGALRGIAVKGAQVVGAEVAEEWTQQTAQWIGNEIAKHTMNELRGTNMPAEDITYLGKRLKDSFLPTIYASIGLAGSSTMMGMSVEGAAQLAGKKVLQAEAAYNMRLHAKQVDEDLTAANAELTDLRTSITESDEDMAYEDAIEDDLSVETASEDIVASEDIDVLQQRIDDLFVPRAEDTGYSLAEHRAVENALKEARLQRSANVREAEQLEMTGRADNAKVVDLPTINAQLDTRINELSERAQGMRESQRRAAQRAIVSGQWDSHEEARTRAGKPMGVSKQDFKQARDENAKGFQELRKTRQELNELRSQEKALEGSRESGKRRSPAQKALREKVKGLRSEMRAERLRLMDEKNNLDMMEGKVGSEVGKRLGDLRTDLKEAGTLGEKSFDASLPGLEREEILSFRNAIYRAWRNAKAAVTAGDREGYARGKEVIRALIAKQRVKQKVFRIQKQMVQGIKKMIRAGAKKTGRVDADTNALFAALRPLLTGKEITNIEEIVALADAGDFQAQISLRVLEMRERAKNRDFSFLKQLHDEIRAVYLGGKEARQVELDTFRTQVNQSIEKITQEIRGPFDIRSRQSGAGMYIDNIKNFFSFFGVDFLYALQDTLAAIVQDSGTHFFDTEAFNVIDTQDAENLRDELQRVYTEEMVSIYAQAYGLKPIPGFGIESVVAARMNAEAISEREALTDEGVVKKIPPVKAGFVRFYHGGGGWTNGVVDGSPRWVTPDLTYAQGYAGKSTGEVYYVDLPEGHPSLVKAFDDTGTTQKAPYVAFELGDENAKNFKKYEDSVGKGEPFKSTDERNPDKFSFNISELRKLYMLIKNDRTRDHFIENQGFTDEVLDAVVRKVEGSPVDLAIVNGQFAIMETLYAKINKVYRKLNNYDLPKQEFYTHITREYTNPDDLNARTLADVMLGADFSHASTSTMSALQRRTASKLPIKIVPDVLDTMDYMRQMAHYIAFAEKSRLWNSVFRSQEFTKELREKYGDKFGQHLQSKLNRYIDDTIRGRAADNRFVWKRMETAMHYIVKLTLAAKAKIGLGQITSLILYLDQMETKEFIVGLNEFMQNPRAAADFLDANSTFFKNRSWRTDQTLIKQFGDLQYGKNKKVETAKFWLSETGDKLMTNVMIGDKVATYMGGYAMARALSKRMSLKAAIRKAETYTKLSQQSSTMSVQSSLQSGGTFERMAAMYSSQQFGMLRLQIRSLRDMFNAKGRYVREKARLKKGAAGATPETVARYRDQYYSQAKKTAKTQAIFQVASPMLFAWVTAGFDWDWPEQLAGLMGALNAIPVVGEVTEALVRMSLGLNKYGSEMVVTQFMNDIVKAGKDLVLDQDKVVQDTAVLLQLVSMGVPLKTIVGIMQGISDVTLEEKIHSGMLRTMGYSEKTAEKAANE